MIFITKISINVTLFHFNQTIRKMGIDTVIVIKQIKTLD